MDNHKLEFFCDYHKELVLKKINRTISNVFYNNERKSRTAAETDDKVREFKKVKKTKIDYVYIYIYIYAAIVKMS